LLSIPRESTIESLQTPDSKGRTMGLFSRRTGAALLFVAIALVSTASAGVNTPQSGWYSGNPLLGPNALRDLACSGSKCYAAGDFGTLLKSTDGGSSWKGIVTGLTLDLDRVGLAGGSADRVVIGADCALRRSDDGGEHFVRLPFTARDTGCASPLVAFSFPTDQIGYVLLAGGRLLATADGGRSFSRRTNVPNVARDLLCTSATTCLAAGIGSIVRTSDGGVSWTVVETTTVAFNRLAAADPLTLYAGAQFTYLSKSVDGGQTWSTSRLPDVPTNDIVDIECGDALHCLMATRNGSLDGPLFRTEDGGISATTVVPSTDPSYTVAFASPLRALAAGALGNAQVSDDDGATWTAVGTRIAGAFNTLAAASPSVAYAGGGQGALVRTADAGQSWSSVSPPTDATLVSLAAVGSERLYVLAADGSLQRSDNGGASYSLLNPGAVRPRAIATVDANRLLLLGTGIIVSKNAGESFDRATGPVARARLFAADLAEGAVFAYGERSIFVSTDRGLHWRRVSRPARRLIFDVDFVDRNNGFLLASGGTLWKTTNGGRRWAQLPTLGAAGFALEFSNRLEGFVTVAGFGSQPNRGVVLRTTNGGRSWHPQLVSPVPVALLDNAGSVEYMLAGTSNLYATDVGGDVGASSRLTISVRPRHVRRAGSVTVSGRLSPADGGEEIVVSRLSGGRWAHRMATAASNGTFVTRWRIGSDSVFVAQVLGDADHRGAGTRALAVHVR
jgi:photosystem II stability/assembly factor-like uncharacterized protein